MIYNDHLVDLVKENFDLAIRGMVSEYSALIVRPVGKLHTCLAATPDYLAQYGVPQQESDLAAHQNLSSQTSTGKPRAWLLQQSDGTAKAYQPTRSRFTTSSTDSLIAAALQGLGITQLPIYPSWRHLQAGILKTVLSDIHQPMQYELSIQYPHRTMLAPRVRARGAGFFAGCDEKQHGLAREREGYAPVCREIAQRQPENVTVMERRRFVAKMGLTT